MPSPGYEPEPASTSYYSASQYHASQFCQASTSYYSASQYIILLSQPVHHTTQPASTSSASQYIILLSQPVHHTTQPASTSYIASTTTQPASTSYYSPSQYIIQPASTSYYSASQYIILLSLIQSSTVAYSKH
ncbi:hypothetical protein CDAR_518631 [Caerostris darwini]|uniref:Uncharacterized protein n=1 Tax=Caerostris darwini TaxID=1538125 RepID=A0AAV4UVJ3_9ARAC|nr:hypothetical protein CDAR_518631 [Caerostris darwini]